MRSGKFGAMSLRQHATPPKHTKPSKELNARRGLKLAYLGEGFRQAMLKGEVSLYH